MGEANTAIIMQLYFLLSIVAAFVAVVVFATFQMSARLVGQKLSKASEYSLLNGLKSDHSFIHSRAWLQASVAASERRKMGKRSLKIINGKQSVLLSTYNLCLFRDLMQSVEIK